MEHKEVLTAEEAAEFLGFKVYTIREKVKAGEIPGRKVGKEWRFTRSALLDWINDGVRRGPVVVVAQDPAGGWSATVEGRQDLRGSGDSQTEAVQDAMAQLETASRAMKYRRELPET